MRLHYDDSNWQTLVERGHHTEDGSPEALPRRTLYGSRAAEAMGLVPMGDYPTALIRKADWKAIIEDCHQRKVFPLYHQEASGLMERWYQDGFGYCWAYGLTASVMGCRALEGQPPVRLSPFSLGWLVGWQNRGFFLDEAIAGAREKGIAPQEFVPEYKLNTREFKAGWQEEALKYRPLEWWDTRRADGTEGMISQCLTVLATGRPLYIAYNWWAHALQCVGMDWDESKPNGITWVLWNSHGDGVIEMSGSRGVPDEAYGVRATTLS